MVILRYLFKSEPQNVNILSLNVIISFKYRSYIILLKVILLICMEKIKYIYFDYFICIIFLFILFIKYVDSNL